MGWSPLALAQTWDGAVLVAESMVRAARPGSDRGEASHWSERAAALLAAVFHAGALERRPVLDVLAAVDRHDPDEVRASLARHGADRALDLLEGIVATEGREQSGIWSTASGVLAGYRTDAALASAQGRILDASELVGGRATLYVCAGSEHQRHAAPLVAGLLREVRSATYQRSLTATVAESGGVGNGGSAGAAWTGASRASSRPPLLLVLDELANIAPLHDLPTLVAEGGSQGVVTLACLQDLAQARARWDREADGFLSLFGTKLVFPRHRRHPDPRGGLAPRRRARSAHHFRHPWSTPERARRLWAGHDPDRVDAQGPHPSRRRHRPGTYRAACSASRAPNLGSCG